MKLAPTSNLMTPRSSPREKHRGVTVGIHMRATAFKYHLLRRHAGVDCDREGFNDDWSGFIDSFLPARLVERSNESIGRHVSNVTIVSVFM